MINWPAPPGGLSTEASWFRKLLMACRQTEILPGVGYRVKETSNGRTLEIIQPPASKGGWRFANPILYDNESSYSFQNVVYVSPDDGLVTTGYQDPDSKITVYASAGMWVALQNVSPRPDPDIRGSFVYHIPQLPYQIGRAHV